MSQAETSAHDTSEGTYPHEGGCPGCRDARVCNVCGGAFGVGKLGGRCTNGRCSRCHQEHCTPGGQTTPGHGYGAVGTVRT